MSKPAKKIGALEITTPTDREIVMTREFDAPRPMVWDALTRPELVRRWLGALEGWTMTVCDIDLRAGGRYRYVWRNVNGTELGMGGVYREVLHPERIVSTERFDQPWYPGEAVGTAVLTEREGRTTLSTTVQYESKEARDAVIATPMAEGVAVGYDKLEEMLTSEGGGNAR